MGSVQYGLPFSVAVEKSIDTLCREGMGVPKQRAKTGSLPVDQSARDGIPVLPYSSLWIDAKKAEPVSNYIYSTIHSEETQNL
jgi:hypothetical protein